MYERDRRLIEKLESHQKGAYTRLTAGDVEYLVSSLKMLARLEEIAESSNSERTDIACRVRKIKQ
jgi:hypothetical protein